MHERSTFSLEVRRAFGPAVVIAILLVACVPVATALGEHSGNAFRDHLDVYALAMSSPLLFAVPLIAVLVTGPGLAQEIGHRYITNKRTRLRIARYLGARYGAAAVVGFAALFLYALVPFVVAFYMWPAMGDPGVDPSLYHLTPSSAARDSYHRFSYTAMLQAGTIAFGLGYSAWLGLCGAVYACAGTAALLLVKNRVLALAIPFIVFFAQTVLAALLGMPQLGLAYSAIPFGLSPSPALVAAAPTVLLAVVVAIVAWRTVRRADDLELLT